MPNFNKAALDALVAANLRENPLGTMEEDAPPSPDGMTPLPSRPEAMMGHPMFAADNNPSEPAPSKRGASWWAHLANLAGAGVNAYGQDRLNQYNKTEGGKSYIGWDADTFDPDKGLAGIQLDAINTPTMPLSPAMGSNPSRGRIYGQNIGTAALMSLAAHFLPKKLGNIGLSLNGASSGAIGGLRTWAAGRLDKSVKDAKSKYEVFMPVDKPLGK